MGITWRDSLAIGVEAIDNQHRELLSRFDRLLNACESGQGADELKSTMSFLEVYIKSHFNDEEALQKLHRFPGYEEHRAQHLYFIGRIRELREEVNREGILVHNVIETNNLLMKWFLNHISKVDSELGKFLLSRNS
ncbi:MAG: hemerythrin family protein [Desulfuromonadaceae bacterium]|nr:hemerythrin family protein [Desulfuromonadaceae bacterium]